jgi:AAA+ ATPase superfamily predicted ATPase
MTRFVGRQCELAELNALLAEPGPQFLILYGRRRVGKTTLLLHWAQESGVPFVYWVANRLSPALQLRSFSQALYNAAHPETPADAEFTYPTWEMALAQAVDLAAERRLILILDEFPYVAEAEPGLPSVLQNTWDHRLKATQIFLVLAGSHIGMMTGLLHYHAPLYGRFTAHLHLKPLPFAATAEFLSRYPAAERVAVYAILGGIPAYLERFDGALSLADNVKRHIFRPTGIFRVDPLFLLQDQVREPRNYLSVLHAIGGGAHTLGEIAEASGLPKQNASTYLGRLADLHLVERRTPVTLPLNERERSRSGRWHLSDSYLRFYFRFIIPNQRALELELVDAVWADMHEQLRAFIGMTAFEELGREWVLAQARSGWLPFAPEDVGSHWSADVQVDVVAINWREKAILLGECKWGTDVVGRGLIRELVEDKTPKVLAELPDRGEGWTVHYAFFARAGFTEAAQAEGERRQVTLVSLAQLDETLRAAAEL